MQNKTNLIIALGIVLTAVLGCSFSTANLSEIQFDKDKSAGNPTTKFNPEDEIFAITAVNNAGGTNVVNFRLLFDDVEGAKSGTVAYKVEKELKTDGSQKVWLNFGVPNGFVPGGYKVEAVLTDDGGKELDRKTADFTVNGSGKNSKTIKPKATPKKNNGSDEEETDGSDKEDNNSGGEN